MAVSLSRGGRGRRGNGEINVTPFVDVVLVLLIIFMVTAPLMLQGMDVNLPETTTQPIQMTNAPLVLTVTKEGQYSIAKQVIASAELQAKLDRFVTLSRSAGLVSEIERRYLENPLRLRVVRRMPTPPIPDEHLTPFDDIFRQAANHNGLDWRLLAAIGQIESSFDPAAEGEGGAAGLMQLMPRTAEAFGAADPYDPNQNVQAAARHLKWIADQLSDVPASERMEFVIAAHNMGLGHVLDAQEVARQRGLDPLRWDNNVAIVMPLLEDTEIASTLTHGRARGSFTLAYVERVRNAYLRYTTDPGAQRVAALPSVQEVP